MEIKAATEAFAALSQETRLGIFRLLVQVGPGGLTAGEIAQQMGVAPSTLSHHLAGLERAGLLRSWRVQRHIHYATDNDGTRRLLDFLVQDCCGGRPELCGDASPFPSGNRFADCNTQACGAAPPEDEMSAKPYNVLFLCTHNSARSVMAECILNRIGQGRFKAFSAGSQPSGRINPFVKDLLGHLGHDVAGLRSKGWNEFASPDAPQMDFIFTVCDSAAGEVCPVWPGHPMTAHWGFADPSSATGTDAEKAAFTADIYRQIERRLQLFVNLPLASLDKLVLKRKLMEMAQQGAMA